MLHIFGWFVLLVSVIANVWYYNASGGAYLPVSPTTWPGIIAAAGSDPATLVGLDMIAACVGAWGIFPGLVAIFIALISNRG